MHFATNVWDTCAPEAVLRAKGGEVSDVFGAPLTYRLDKPSLVNEFNAFATAPGFAAAWGAAPEAVCADMRRSPPLLRLLEGRVGALPPDPAPQAADVARCLKGLPLSTAFLEEKVQPPEGYTLTHYSAPEAGASRDLMSDVCRLELHWEAGAGAGAVGGPTPPRSVFYKVSTCGRRAGRSGGLTKKKSGSSWGTWRTRG